MYGRREVITEEHAGFAVRLVAYLIDGVVLAILSLIILRIAYHFSGSTDDGQVIPVAVYASSGGINALVASIGNILSIAYVVAFWAWRGQTPGKMVMGIKIVRTDGSPIGIGGAILRYIGYIVSGLMFCIGFLWIALDPEKQAVHDKIAGTYVIRQSRQRKPVQVYG
jgi:uncharacterized RDD family membrane protein YckC